jgi:hypothetical protein
VRSYRRMATVAALGALAAAALSSCGIKPDVAATVGPTTITEKRVDQAYDSVSGQISRPEIVQDLVVGAACKNYAQANNITYDVSATEKQLEQQGAPPGVYVDALAEKNACLAAAVTQTETQPTDAELRKLYDDLVKLDPQSAQTPFDQAKQQFLQIPQVLQVFGLVHGYNKVAKDQHISVNPRYRTLSIALKTTAGVVLVDVPIGEPSNTGVTDAPSPAQTEARTPPPTQPTS